MKKMFFLLFLAAGIVSCSKDKEDNKPQTITLNPMKDIAAMDPNNGVSNGSDGKYQVGIRFIAYKEGTISRLGLRSPSEGTYRVQLFTFVSNDSITLNYPFISAPQRLGYTDVTIDANAAKNGTVVWGDIASVRIMPWNTDGAGKVRHYGVCYNDHDLTQYQLSLPAGVTMPLRFGNSLSVMRYSFILTDDQNTSAWGASGGGFGDLIYGGEQFEFVTGK